MNNDEQLVEHYRQNQRQEPPAALDASILAAANAQARKTGSQSVWMRLYSWASHKRWSVAFGSLAVVGLAVGLVFNGYQSSSSIYDNPQPAAAPAMQGYAAPALKRERVAAPQSAPRMQHDESADAISAESAMPSAPVVETHEANKSQAKMAPGALADTDDLEAQLQQIIQLRNDGQTQQAEALGKALQEQYPTIDIEQRLQELRAQDK